MHKEPFVAKGVDRQFSAASVLSQPDKEAVDYVGDEHP